jgi:EpsD family peptidyl-prolyl cis-trans isomerase
MASWSGAICCASAALFLAGCQKPVPTGQVAATVGPQEITVRALRAEMRPVNGADPKQAKAAESATLKSMVARALVAQEAARQGLDKTPDFALQKQRLTEMLLVELLEAKIAKEVPAPSRDEAQAFVTAHPAQFANRKIFQVEQIAAAPPPNLDLRPIIQPLNSLDQVQAALTAKNVSMRRGTTAIDPLSLDPKLADSIANLPPNAVFMLPSGNFFLINQIRAAQPAPVGGEPAVAAALQYLQRQQAQQAVAKALGAVVTRGARNVRYNASFAPPAHPQA